MRRENEMLTAAALIGLLANPNSHGRYAHTRERLPANDRAAFPTYAEWIAKEAQDMADAISPPIAEETEPEIARHDPPATETKDGDQ